MNILRLTLKRKWFDMIASGEKREEYREIKPYWNKRLLGKDYTHVLFRNGYSKSARSMLVVLHLIYTAKGSIHWGAPENDHVYVLGLGEIIERFDEVKR